MKCDSKQIKRVLITQSALRLLAGSEIVTFELASYFQKNNIDITVFTWYYSDPIKKEFEKNKIHVITDETDKALDKPFDLVWINHQVLPESIIKKINKTSSTYYLFNHMSSLDSLYLEQPYVYGLESQIGTASLFVSDESMSFNKKKYGDIFNNRSVFPNMSPEKFLKSVTKLSASKKILIVSNHPPEEIKNAKPLLEKAGFIVESIGQTNTKYSLITPKILKQYCCVITIGKTVQYCLTLNIPVYIYDHFGGCGFLNNKNYEKAKNHNFSGRGFDKKDPRQITKEILEGINTAHVFQTKNLEKFKTTFSLNTNLQKLLSTLPPKARTIDFSPEYINYIVGSELLTKQKIIAENNLCILQEIHMKSQENLESVKAIIDNLKKQNSELEATTKAMQNSRIIKIDQKIRSIIPFNK